MALCCLVPSAPWHRIDDHSNQQLVWVGDLPPGTTNELLKRAFQQFGDVDRAVVAINTATRDPLVSSKLSHWHFILELIAAANCRNIINLTQSYGFVEFSKPGHAKRCLEDLASRLLCLSADPRPVRVRASRLTDMEEGAYTSILSRIPSPPRCSCQAPPYFIMLTCIRAVIHCVYSEKAILKRMRMQSCVGTRKVWRCV